MASKELSRKLKELRIQSGFTQKQICEKFSLPQSTISGWEIGRAEPSGEMLIKLLELYGSNMVDVLHNDDLISQSEMNMIKKYRELDVTGKETVDYILDKQHERVSHHDWLLSAVSEAIEEEELDIPTPHPYHGVDEDKVREVIERNTAKYLGKLSSELRILQHNKDMNDIKKGDD